MTPANPKPSDVVYSGIASTDGWSELLDRAKRDVDGRDRVGRVISSVLLAGGEGTVPIAISGWKSTDDRPMGLAVIYHRFIVLVSLADGRTATSHDSVSVHTFDSVRDLRVTSNQSYYDDSTADSRHANMSFEFSIAGQTIVFARATEADHPLRSDKAVLHAYQTIRDNRGASATPRDDVDDAASLE